MKNRWHLRTPVEPLGKHIRIQADTGRQVGVKRLELSKCVKKMLKGIEVSKEEYALNGSVLTRWTTCNPKDCLEPAMDL